MDEQSRSIKIHSDADFLGMQVAGRLAADTLDYISEHVTPGVTTGELDRKCAEFIAEKGAISAPLNYRGYPKSVCISANHVVCHGIPGDKILSDGDIVNIDVCNCGGEDEEYRKCVKQNFEYDSFNNKNKLNLSQIKDFFKKKKIF